MQYAADLAIPAAPDCGAGRHRTFGLQKPELMSLPPRSRYILLDEPLRAVLAGRLNLDPVATLPYGTLY